MKKILIISLLFSLSSLFGMEKIEKNNKEQTRELVQQGINWAAYKKLYFKAYGSGPIGTEERWKCFKKGVTKGVIKMSSISQAPEPWTTKSYYLAYSEKINLDDNKVTRFMYPSPNNPYSDYPIKDTDVLYTIDTAETSVLVTAQWNTNRGEDNEKSLPLELQPLQEYFPDWKNNTKLWVYWTNIKTMNNQNK